MIGHTMKNIIILPLLLISLSACERENPLQSVKPERIFNYISVNQTGTLNQCSLSWRGGDFKNVECIGALVSLVHAFNASEYFSTDVRIDDFKNAELWNGYAEYHKNTGLHLDSSSVSIKNNH